MGKRIMGRANNGAPARIEMARGLKYLLAPAWMLALGLYSSGALGGDLCAVEETSPMFGERFSGDSYTFEGLGTITEVLDVQEGDRNWIDCSGDDAYSVSGNTILTAAGCRARFTVSGTDPDCEQGGGSGGVSIARTPLNVILSRPPNILLMMDNSNSMVEGLEGSVAASCPPGPDADCVAGAASPLSKSEMIRVVGRRLINDYMGRVNLGLMAYQQPPPSDDGTWDDSVILADLVDRIYDVSYNPNNYDPDFSGSPWDDSRKRFRIPNPSSPGDHIHFNIRVPGYTTGTGAQSYYRTRESGDDWQEEPFLFDCFRSKTGTSDNLSVGYSSSCGGVTGGLNDSARARGVTHWGQRMVALPFNTQEWITVNSPGLGYLHTPIKALDEAHRDRLAKKLAPQHHDYSPDLLTDPEEPIIAAGLTPLEGTMLTARDYFLNDRTHFARAQGRPNAEYPLPEACEVNAAIWLTDGMPSVTKDGEPLGEDTDRALADAVAATRTLHEDAGVDVYVVGFSMPPTVSQDALQQLSDAGGTSRPYLANRPEQLDDAMNRVFDNIIESTRDAGTAVAVNSSQLEDGTLAFLSGYRSADWTGELVAYELEEDGTYGDMAWNAENRLRNRNQPRNLFTLSHSGAVDDADPVRLDLGALSGEQQTALGIGLDGNTDGLGAARIAWLYGEEHDNLRSRNSEDGLRLLGDIVHSTPQLDNRRNFGYQALPGDEGASYGEFRTRNSYQNRPDMLFVGSNGGMLHGFNANNGNELFAYVPSELLLPGKGGDHAQLNELMDLDYNHRYFVDGVATVGDAYWGSDWHTVLVGTMGAGGRTVFALDVSTRGLSEDDVLWEFTHPDLGYGVKEPQIVRMNNGEWAAVFGNGYNSDNDRAVLFVVRLSDGELIAKIDTGHGSAEQPNGLAAPAITDWPNRNLNAGLIYAGDLEGRIWRFDVSSDNPNHWDRDNNRSVLFQAMDGNGPGAEPQPITSRPVIARDPTDNERVVVIFGTGSYFRVNDADMSAPQTQSFYGIFDTARGESGNDRGDLLQQSITWQGEFSVTGPDGESLSYFGREVSENDVENRHAGWYLDLEYQGDNEGERVVANPRLVGLQNERVRFSTLIPSGDPCNPGRTGRISDLQLFSGGSNAAPVFDLNRDGEFDSDDSPDGRIISAIGFGGGTDITPISDGDRLEYLLRNDPDQGPMRVDPGRSPLGRQSWQQLR